MVLEKAMRRINQLLLVDVSTDPVWQDGYVVKFVQTILADDCTPSAACDSEDVRNKPNGYWRYFLMNIS